MFKSLHAMVHLCEEKFEVFQVDAHNLLGVVNRGSPRLILNELARQLFLVLYGASYCYFG